MNPSRASNFQILDSIKKGKPQFLSCLQTFCQLTLSFPTNSTYQVSIYPCKRPISFFSCLRLYCQTCCFLLTIYQIFRHHLLLVALLFPYSLSFPLSGCYS